MWLLLSVNVPVLSHTLEIHHCYYCASTETCSCMSLIYKQIEEMLEMWNKVTTGIYV